MGKLKTFIMTSLLGGVMVVLPVVILAAVFGWVFHFVTGIIRPITNLIVANSDIKGFIADGLVLVIILVICFLIGLIVKTNLGNFLYGLIEGRLLKIAPGYNLIKETVLQILGSKKSPFSKVVLAQIFENNTLVTGFVTDEHSDGTCTIFVPTGPNPTSGVIYHLNARFVHPVDVSAEDAMRSIISCGAGSSKLIQLYRNKISG